MTIKQSQIVRCFAVFWIATSKWPSCRHKHFLAYLETRLAKVSANFKWSIISALIKAMTYPTLFNEKRTAQAAAFFLHQARGRLPLLKLMKLMYLAERESLKQFGEPISGDKLVSMPMGPVLSTTYNLMNGAVPSVEGGWDSWMEDRSGHDIALRDVSMIRSPELDLLELSDGDLEVLGQVWAEFGHMRKYDLVNHTHSDACPEWIDPRGSSRPIPMGRLFRALGYSDAGVRSAVEHLNEQAQLNAAVA